MESCVRGHHVFGSIWSPTIGEQLVCKRQSGNPQDVYAVAVMRGATVVGHVPRKISAACSIFLRRKGTIRCTVSASRRYSADLPQGGLEVPCILKFQGDTKDVAKVRKLVLPISITALEPQPPSKKRKIVCKVVEISDGLDDTSSKPWLTFNGIELNEADRATILSGDCLTDKHVNFAQSLLKKQFGSIAGLKWTLVLAQLQDSPYHRSEVLQIIHCRGNHWIVVSSLRCPTRVQVFDSMFSSIDEMTRNMLTQLFGEESSIEMGDGPKQNGGSDCGVFVIATSTSLAHGCYPHDFKYEQMRVHLVKCFENLCLSVFP